MLCPPSGAAGRATGDAAAAAVPEATADVVDADDGEDPTCACCLNDIDDDEYVQALGKSFHPECFR